MSAIVDALWLSLLVLVGLLAVVGVAGWYRRIN